MGGIVPSFLVYNFCENFCQVKDTIRISDAIPIELLSYSNLKKKTNYLSACLANRFSNTNSGSYDCLMLLKLQNNL